MRKILSKDPYVHKGIGLASVDTFRFFNFKKKEPVYINDENNVQLKNIL